MSEAEAKSYAGKFLAFLALVAVPLLSALAYRREISIATLFFLRDYIALSTILFVFFCCVIWVFCKSFWEAGVALQRIEDQLLGRYRYLVLICLIALCLEWFGVLRWRYKIFSEVYYQDAAIRSINSGDMKGARLICERYIQLFPQRSKGGSIPDPVCVDILDFAQGMSFVRDYIRKQNYAGRTRDNIYFVPANAARAEALAELEKFAGGL